MRKPPWRLLAALLLAWWAVPTLLFVAPERLFQPDAQDRAIAALARSIPREHAVHVDPDFAPLVACRPRATLETELEQRPLARCADDLLLWSERRPGHMDADLTWLRTAALTLSPRFAVAGRAGGAVHLVNVTGRSWAELSAARCLTPTQEDQDVR